LKSLRVRNSQAAGSAGLFPAAPEAIGWPFWAENTRWHLGHASLPGDSTIISFGGIEYWHPSQVAFKSRIKENGRPSMKGVMHKFPHILASERQKKSPSRSQG
jgi:hypothetical protein